MFTVMLQGMLRGFKHIKRIYRNTDIGNAMGSHTKGTDILLKNTHTHTCPRLCHMHKHKEKRKKTFVFLRQAFSYDMIHIFTMMSGCKCRSDYCTCKKQTQKPQHCIRWCLIHHNNTDTGRVHVSWRENNVNTK